MDRYLHFQLLSSLLTLGKKKFLQFFYSAKLFWLGSCMSHVVSTIGEKYMRSDMLPNFDHGGFFFNN